MDSVDFALWAREGLLDSTEPDLWDDGRRYGYLWVVFLISSLMWVIPLVVLW